MSHKHSWTYFYVPGDAYRYCACGARETVAPDGATGSVPEKERAFVEKRIEKLEKKAERHRLYTKLATFGTGVAIGTGAGALLGAGYGLYENRDDPDYRWRGALARGAQGALIGLGLGGVVDLGRGVAQYAHEQRAIEKEIAASDAARKAWETQMRERAQKDRVESAALQAQIAAKREELRARVQEKVQARAQMRGVQPGDRTMKWSPEAWEAHGPDKSIIWEF